MLLQLQPGEHVLTVRLAGAWHIDNIAELEQALAQIPGEATQNVRVDCSGIERLDLSGAWLLQRRLQKVRDSGVEVEVVGGQERPALTFVTDLAQRATPAARSQPSAHVPWPRRFAGAIGRSSVYLITHCRDGVGFFGRIAVTTLRMLRSAHHLRLPSVTRHIYETGIQAIPIVSLIAFLISVIIAYLSAQQLRQFGADIFTVDLVAIAVLREMGVLLTAIIVAGRSGSAFAAELGVMRLNDEVDALQSMGVDYFEVLVLPRVVGLLIALPLLTIIADAMGLAGGALLSQALLDISLTQFIPRVQEALAPTTFWAGLIKAPVFALVIALVGTYRGMQVRDSSRELGRLTTVAVVESIFLVIFVDAIFAVIFVELDF
jgi:phospholipid/cholesterol/gamma-HCH transport system permease protein